MADYKTETIQLRFVGCGCSFYGIEREFAKLEGYKEMHFDASTLKIGVKYDPEKLDRSKLVQAVERAGYRVKR
ncbi:MAG: cation transporter [Candidatus Bipolaricaulia bacterium]